MLQYIITDSDRYSVGELAQMAVEGGCKWISLALEGASDEFLREVAPEVVELCREAGVFLTIDDRPDMARELGLHGVRLSRRFFTENPSETPAKVRDDLGPEAIIGIETADASAVATLVAADIDFVMLPGRFTRAERARFAAVAAPLEMPMVACGIKTVDEAREALADGCSGVAVSRAVASGADPVAAMEAFMAAVSPGQDA